MYFITAGLKANVHTCT